MTKLDAKALEAALKEAYATPGVIDIVGAIEVYLDALPPARRMYLVADDPVASGETVKEVEIREVRS